MSEMAMLRQLRLVERLEQRSVWLRASFLLERNEDFRAGVPFFGVREGVGGFSQRIASVDLRREFSGLAELAKGRQVVSIHFRNEKCELLPDER